MLKKVTWHEVDVDHTGDQYEFQQIVAKFLAGKPCTAEVDIAAFAKFHEKHAVLQILCKHCNQTKLDPGAAPQSNLKSRVLLSKRQQLTQTGNVKHFCLSKTQKWGMP